jgi:hypothetical protein
LTTNRSPPATGGGFFDRQKVMVTLRDILNDALNLVDGFPPTKITSRTPLWRQRRMVDSAKPEILERKAFQV